MVLNKDDILAKAEAKLKAEEEEDQYRNTCRKARICPYCGEDVKVVWVDFGSFFVGGGYNEYTCPIHGEINYYERIKNEKS